MPTIQVFVSSDREEADFAQYFGEQPWLALPFGGRKRKARLSKRFRVSGIPALVILAPDGTLIAANDQIFTQLAKAVRKSG